MILIRDMRLEDIFYVSKNMRQADKIEVKLIGGLSPYASLLHSYNGSIKKWTVLEDGIPIACFGVGAKNLVIGEGIVWFLGTDRVEKKARVFALMAMNYIHKMYRYCSVLYNITHSKNKKAITLLKYLGFSFDPPIDVKGNMFIPFFRENV